MSCPDPPYCDECGGDVEQNTDGEWLHVMDWDADHQIIIVITNAGEESNGESAMGSQGRR